MAYMTAGDFQEARDDFKMEVEKKARNQFKGLFDKKPGEIAEAKVEDTGGDETTGLLKENNEDDPDETSSERSHETAPDDQRRSWFSLLWPSSRRLVSALGLNRCSIL